MTQVSIAESELGCRIGGAVWNDHVPLFDWLPGQTITMMLYNGIVVTGVKVDGFDEWLGKRQVCYQLPNTAGQSKCELLSIAYMYVHYPNNALNDPSPHPITIHKGDCRPMTY